MEKLRVALKKASIETKNCSCAGPECDNSCENNNEKTPLLEKQKTFSIQFSSSFNNSYEIIDMTHENNNNELISDEIKIDYEEVEDKNCEDNGLFDNCWFRLILIPISFIMSLTIPKPSKKYFVITFIVSIAWLALLSYFTVTSVQFLSKKFIDLFSLFQI